MLGGGEGYSQQPGQERPRFCWDGECGSRDVEGGSPGPAQSPGRGVCGGTGGASPCLKVRRSLGRPEQVTHGSLENTGGSASEAPCVSPGPRPLAQDPR